MITVLLVAAATKSEAEPRRTFAALTVFGGCHMEHLCGAGPNGGVGPVGKDLWCNQYVFQPDGTYTYKLEFKRAVRGRYTRVGRTVTLTPITSSGAAGTARRLTLSADGNELDGLRRRGS